MSDIYNEITDLLNSFGAQYIQRIGDLTPRQLEFTGEWKAISIDSEDDLPLFYPEKVIAVWERVA